MAPLPGVTISYDQGVFGSLSISLGKERKLKDTKNLKSEGRRFKKLLSFEDRTFGEWRLSQLRQKIEDFNS